MTAGATVTLVVALITGVGGIITAIVTAMKVRSDTGHTDAQTESLSVTTMRSVLEEIRKERDKLAVTLEAMEVERAEWTKERARLHTEISRFSKFLRALLPAFEAELVALGGDPHRLREIIDGLPNGWGEFPPDIDMIG